MTIHIYGPTQSNSVRLRTTCPQDGKLVYGRLVRYYDTDHMNLDCGVQMDRGYEAGWYWPHPGPRGGRGRPKVIPKKCRERYIDQWVRTWQHRIASFT